MDKVTILEFFLRGLPEAFLFIMAAYGISGTKFDPRRYLMTSSLAAVISLTVKLLPIQPGFNTVINLFSITVIMILLNKLDVIVAIRTSIIIVIIECICEVINIVLIHFYLKLDVDSIFSQPEFKAFLGLPSLVLFGFVIFIYIHLIRADNNEKAKAEDDAKIK